MRSIQGTGVLSGVVTDATGAVVPGAIATLIPAGGRAEKALAQQTSDAQGRVTFRLAPGTYDLRVEAPGFGMFEQGRLTLKRDGVMSLSIRLAVASLHQEISVPGDQDAETDPNQGGGTLVFEGQSLDMLSNDDATLRQQLQALAGTMGTPTFLVNGFSGGRLPSKSSIRSIRINGNPYSSYFAEYGSGRIEVTTQPGGDKVHGSVQFSGTDQALDARNPYSPLKPDYYDFQHQGTLSGPLGRKTSYFLSDSIDRLANSAVVNAADPANPGDLLSTVAPAPELTQVYALRLDRKFSEKNFGYMRDEWSLTQQTNSGIQPLVLPVAAFAAKTLTNTLQLTDTQVLGVHAVNEVRFQYLRTRLNQDPNSVLPSVVVQGSFQGGGAPTQRLRDKQDAYELQDAFETDRGRHAVRTGVRLRVLRDANRSSAGFNGQYLFPDVASYLAGQATQYSQTVGEQSAVVLTEDVGVFAEDDWKITPKFTLSYGMRFESQSAIPDHRDPAPRVAFSWAVQPGKRTTPIVTVRGGYGLFYDRFPVAQLLQSVRQNGTRQVAYLAQNTGFDPQGPPPGLVLSAGEPTIYEVNPEYKSNYTEYGGASVQRSLGKYGSVSGNFLYAHDAHLLLSRNLNAPLPGTVLPGVADSGTRPFGAENLYAFSSDANGNLERFALNFYVKPVSRFYVFGVLNTEKHLTETDGVEHFPSNEYDLRHDYGRSALTRAVWFTGGLRWQLPLGVQMTSFLDTHTGVPFDITTGDDRNEDTIYNDRPGFGTGAASASMVATSFGQFDVAPTGAVIPRNYGTSPGYFYLQMVVGKDFALGPRPAAGAGAAQGTQAERPWNLNFSIEVHNLTNHNNPGTPVGVLSVQPCTPASSLGCSLTPSAYFGHSLSLANDFGAATASNRAILLETSFSW